VAPARDIHDTCPAFWAPPLVAADEVLLDMAALLVVDLDLIEVGVGRMFLPPRSSISGAWGEWLKREGGEERVEGKVKGNEKSGEVSYEGGGTVVVVQAWWCRYYSRCPVG
jgi:hypothetical protein